MAAPTSNTMEPSNLADVDIKLQPEQGKDERRVCSDDSDESGAATHKMARITERTANAGRWVRSLPYYLWWSLAVFAVLETVAVVGCYYFVRSVRNDSYNYATEVARSSGRELKGMMEGQKAPIVALNSFIRTHHGHWPTIISEFDEFTKSLYDRGYQYYALEAMPHGRILAMQLPWLELEGQDKLDFLLGFDLGVDLLNRSRYDWVQNTASIFHNDSIILMPPWYMPDGDLSEGAFVLRQSIFMKEDPAEPWEIPAGGGYPLCPADVCTLPDGSRFWGWSASIFAWRAVKTGLRSVVTSGLMYSLSPDVRSVNQTMLAHSAQLPSGDASCVIIEFYDWLFWTLCVSQPGGWYPAWTAGLIIGFTALVVIVSVLIFYVLRSREQAQTSLGYEKIANESLVEEKERMDLMMQRQHQLINLLQPATPTAQAGRLATTESTTQDRIWEIRRQLSASVNVSASGADPDNAGGGLTLQEMLGEGSFGRVYRGTWRGVEVAVKMMLFPLSMGGAEKREKMLIMETAISSALAHPNIVQTYTYNIDQMRENEAGSVSDGMVLGTNGASSADLHQQSIDKSAGAGASARGGTSVHGYEVRLILEYCDRGCLRDALSGFAFHSEGGLNYAAMLDIALDVAKAMLHLHAAHVVHGDLKARNVMLKTSGADGRTSIAKVADFGLATKINGGDTHLSNLFQGTMTHMAPELLLFGRMSKPSDVYAFAVTLWEIFTGGRAFDNTPPALLGHQVIHEQRRPEFPVRPPKEFEALVNDCWEAEAEARPSFEQIVQRLGTMRAALPRRAPPLSHYIVATVSRKSLFSDAMLLSGDGSGAREMRSNSGLVIGSSSGGSITGSFGAPLASNLRMLRTTLSTRSFGSMAPPMPVVGEDAEGEADTEHDVEAPPKADGEVAPKHRASTLYMFAPEDPGA
ncbi:hypothetical protein FOA52_009672 [Chlamydomonas sp. UWO 241]|nr:hypothetical protein FOA52_009672 [Chlamydomonas sp. UWO 241]